MSKCHTVGNHVSQLIFSVTESDVYEDPRVLYELIEQNPEPITKENYLVGISYLFDYKTWGFPPGSTSICDDIVMLK